MTLIVMDDLIFDVATTLYVWTADALDALPPADPEMISGQ